MSAPQFTPEPWKLRIEPYEDDPFPGKDYFVLSIADDTITGITTPANARLLAAAPELYEALEEAHAAIQAAMAQIDAEERDHMRIAAKHEQIVRAWSEKRRAALAKARGEAA